MNYEEFIERAFSEGETPEQIAALFSKALNKKEQEVKEKIAQQEAKEKYLTELRVLVGDDEHSLTFDDAAALATLVVADQKRDWTIEQLEEYRTTAREQLEGIVTVLEWCNKFESAVNKSKEKVEDKIKEKEKRAAPIGKSSDKEIVEAFLKRLGL